MVVVFLYLTIVLSVLGRVTNRWCNYMLRVLHLLVETIHIGTSPTCDSTDSRRIIETLPRDIRGVRNVFNLEAKTITYAACPKCSCTYEPEIQDGISVYPSLCAFRPFPNSDRCGTRITKTHVHNGKSIRIPLRPFVIQTPESFIAAMLCRPGMEDVLVRGMEGLQQPPVMEDIGHGRQIGRAHV